MTTVDIVTVENKKLFAVELAVLLLLFVGQRYRWIPFPITPFLFALAWISLRLRGFHWRDVGFTAPGSWLVAVVAGVAVGAAIGALGVYVTQPLFRAITGEEFFIGESATVHGNVSAFAAVLVVMWLLFVLAGELVFRGYLMTRFARMLSGGRNAWVMSLVVVSLLFGLAHGDRGMSGMLENVVKGFVLGGLYLATGRNLVAPIIAHGVANTIELTLLFLGTHPGT